MEFVNITPEAQSFLDEWNDDSLFVTARTSGSTGIPKEIRLLKKDMMASAAATCRFFNIQPKDRLLCPLSANYIAGKMMIVRAIVSGADLIFESPSRSPMQNDYGEIKLLPIVPAQLAGLDREKVNKVRNLLIGGAPLSPSQEEYAATLPSDVYVSYGMTETCSHIALRKVGEAPFYTALPGVTFETDSESCLKINAPDFSFGTLRTNDVVKIISSTSFQWLGRKDNVVISGGLKLHPEMIEQKIGAMITAPYYLLGEEDEQWGQKLVMYVKGEEDRSVWETLKKILTSTEMPKDIRFVPEFEYTASSKVKRILL